MHTIKMLDFTMRKLLLTICILSLSGVAMSEGIFLHSYNELSDRYAILDEHGNTGVLYLSENGSQKPEKDAFAYMLVSPISKSDWIERMKAGEPPILHTEIASESAVLSSTKESDFSFKWAHDGLSVALLYKNIPIAFATLSRKFGYSKSVTENTPIVNVWDESLFGELFN